MVFRSQNETTETALNGLEPVYLGLEGLMLLDLGLEVGGIFVVLVGRGLELLVDPGLELVGIASEVLEPPRLLQLLPLDLRGLLELDIATENLHIKMKSVKRSVSVK